MQNLRSRPLNDEDYYLEIGETLFIMLQGSGQAGHQIVRFLSDVRQARLTQAELLQAAQPVIVMLGGHLIGFCKMDIEAQELLTFLRKNLLTSFAVFRNTCNNCVL